MNWMITFACFSFMIVQLLLVIYILCYWLTIFSFSNFPCIIIHKWNTMRWKERLSGGVVLLLLFYIAVSSQSDLIYSILVAPQIIITSCFRVANRCPFWNLSTPLAGKNLISLCLIWFRHLTLWHIFFYDVVIFISLFLYFFPSLENSESEDTGRNASQGAEAREKHPKQIILCSS